MSELAFNYTGQRFSLPGEAMYWRVRRIRDGHRGRLDVVLSAAGLPLTLPIDAGIEELRVAVGDVVGRYRLDALDAAQMPLADVEAAYVSVPMPRSIPDPEECAPHRDEPPANVRNAAPPVPWTPPATVTAPFGTWPALPMPAAMTGTEYLLAEALRGQVQMFQMVTAALSNQTASTSSGASQMMSAAAELVRAADGAAMPHRPPPPPPAPPPTTPAGPAPTLPPIVFAAPGSVAARNASPAGAAGWDDEDPDGDDGGEGETDDGADGASGEADMFAKILALADKVQGVIAPVADVARLVMGGMGGGVRNAAPADATADAPEPDGANDGPDESAHLRASHILLIAHELGADGSLFRRLLMAMEPEDRHALTEHLCSMPFEEAVADAAAKLERIKRRQAAREGVAARARHVAQSPADVSPAGADREGDPSDDDDSDGERDPDDGDGADLAQADAADQTPDRQGAPDLVLDQADQAEPHQDVPVPVPATAGPVQTPPVASTTVRAAPAIAPAGITPAVQARMTEIAKHLRVSEILQARVVINQIAGPEREAMFAKLMALPPAEAAQAVRAELARRAAR